MATVKDMLRCPKCGKQMMGKAHPQKWGREYYAHCCHLYLGIDELVYQWGYDAGDLFSTAKSASKFTFNKLQHDSDFLGEPLWYSILERDDAYAMVSRMLFGVPELRNPFTPDKRLRWDELANLYDKSHPSGRPARTLPMDTVYGWAKSQPNKFYVDDEGYIYKVEPNDSLDEQRTYYDALGIWVQ